MISNSVTAAPLAVVMEEREGVIFPIENEPIMTLKKTIMTSPPEIRPSATRVGPYLDKNQDHYGWIQINVHSPRVISPSSYFMQNKYTHKLLLFYKL